MIEVPSAIFLAAALADRVDFLSIGTNDLTQYMLAVDRNNARGVTPYDSLHPAVLNAIQHLIREALGVEGGVDVHRLLSGAFEEVGVSGY
jgi:phosphotransferase system enzyme I (PtsP)